MSKRKAARRSRGRARPDRLRWAVVGPGYFAQTAVLPAFAHARDSGQLVALFSDDQKKRERLARQHKVAFALPYEEYDDFLRSGEVEAVYIALPNHLHREYTVRAARAGVHVLCEKPMAVTPEECEEMIEACQEARVKLMVAYRLHLEPANLTAIEEIRRGRLGDPRYFESAFSFVPVSGGAHRGSGPDGPPPSQAGPRTDRGAGRRGAEVPGRSPGQLRGQFRRRRRGPLHRVRSQRVNHPGAGLHPLGAHQDDHRDPTRLQEAQLPQDRPGRR
jgi:hypothetical protein